MWKQLILFGSPGTGKSYRIDNEIATELGIGEDKRDNNVIKTVFHPEYKYSDFMGKLLPLSSGNSIIYRYYPGHFLQALGKAYRGIIDNNGENYLFVIDELNRGNAAAIFGSVFQLLDRNDGGFSTYGINISDMEMVGLLNSMGNKATINHGGSISVDDGSFDRFVKDLRDKKVYNFRISFIINVFTKKKIRIPPNLSIVCTINTSDESIYYLDTAFKRRWDWEYIEAPCEELIINELVPPSILTVELLMPEGVKLEWYRVIVGVNKFIKSCYRSIRKIEDKQIGWWFIIPEVAFINEESFSYTYVVSLEKVRNKLMFYLWDSVYARDKKPLESLLQKITNKDIEIVTYADFLKYSEQLINYWHESVPEIESLF